MDGTSCGMSVGLAVGEVDKTINAANASWSPGDARDPCPSGVTGNISNRAFESGSFFSSFTFLSVSLFFPRHCVYLQAPFTKCAASARYACFEQCRSSSVFRLRRDTSSSNCWMVFFWLKVRGALPLSGNRRQPPQSTVANL